MSGAIEQARPGGLGDFVMRAGLASILVGNSIVALVAPGEFERVIAVNFIGRHLHAGVVSGMVGFVVVNDLALGLVILSGRLRQIAYVWLGAWLTVVAAIRITNLVW